MERRILIMGHNNFFKVDVEKQKNKYWIFKELQSKQAVVVPNVSKKDWWPSVSRNIGRENKNIIIDGEKVLHGPSRNIHYDEAYIIRKNNVTLEEIKKGMISKFYPKIIKK